MNYIGSKLKLSNWIEECIKAVVDDDLKGKVFCDIFAGTGIVGRTFKSKVKKVISNDFEYYAYVLNKNYIGNHKKFENLDNFIKTLNEISPKKGFIYENYCLDGSGERQYFSGENGMKIDAIRAEIEIWKDKGKIDSQIYYFLLASLLESADRVANTASVYGAYLKKLKKSAQLKLDLQPAKFETDDNEHEVFNENANLLIQKIKGDIIYLDPPYNTRQYGANYHLLNTIALYDDFKPQGKTGLREYQRSKYCSKSLVKDEFQELIKNANFKYIFLSYNNEGLMSKSEIKEIMSKYGEYSFKTKEYKRFKADNDRNNKADETKEYLHILVK